MEEKKEDNTLQNNMEISAKLTIAKNYNMPLAKLTVSGCINQSDANKVNERAIIFVIDRSRSMRRVELPMIKETLKPFIETICDDPNTIIRLVLFNQTFERVQIPKNKKEAGKIIENIQSQKGTNFHAASYGLVQEAKSILNDYPNHQLTVIMCSDGEVSKQNAEKGHSHWKDFVNADYLRCHTIVPYVECIGISSDHDADVLDGFIIDDEAGNYCKCLTPETIREAYENAQSETMGRTATKLHIEFPMSAQKNVYNSAQQKKNKNDKFTLTDFIVTSDEFCSTFWIDLEQTKGGDLDGMHLIVNGMEIVIEIEEVVDAQQCQCEAIAFYEQVLKDMLFTLRSITDENALLLKAKEIENELSNEYNKTFETITAEPAEKKKLQNEIKALLVVEADEQKEEDLHKKSKQRAALMKQYKSMSQIWKQHRRLVTPFQHTLARLKEVVREIILGRTRMQEIRQHILDLHFNKKHAKRISKLVLTDDQLAQRQTAYEKIIAPTDDECKEIDDEWGSGCYLSTLSKRECVIDAEPLWMCGRVNRTGGVSVSNPELIRIEYVSPDLVSDSYFKMAIEATEREADGFADSCRGAINCRLFPIYANLRHLECSKPMLNESLSHTLSGRMDIRVTDYNSLCATIGHMICRNQLNYKNVKRILFEMMPSFQLFGEHSFCRPYKQLRSREIDTTKKRIKLSQRNRMRLKAFTHTFKARTTALVSSASVLFSDRLMNLDIDFGADCYLSLIIQRMRGLFSAQIPNDNNQKAKAAMTNHKMILQTLICGHPNDKDDQKEKNAMEFNTKMGEKKRFKAYSKLFNVPKIDPAQLDKSDDAILAKWNVKKIKASTKKMMLSILSHIECRDLIQSKMFFDTLSNLKLSEIDPEKYSFDEFGQHEFSSFDAIPNDLKILLKQIGFDGNTNVNVLRAICCVAITCHSNKLWQSNLHWLSAIFTDPEAVLTHVYKHFVIPHQRYEWNLRLEELAREQLIAIHSDPPLPDDIDEFGNLPQLRCGWKKCGKVFTNRDQLLHHVACCYPRPFIHRFHLTCEQVLEQNTNVSMEQFVTKARNAFDAHTRKGLHDDELRCYYKQFHPIYGKGVRPSLQRENRRQSTPPIISNGNMYYWDVLVKVQKF